MYDLYAELTERSLGKVIRCVKCGCTGKTLIAHGQDYICRDCLEKEEGRR